MRRAERTTAHSHTIGNGGYGGYRKMTEGGQRKPSGVAVKHSVTTASASASPTASASASPATASPTFQLRFPKVSYNLSESLNHQMFKDVEIPLLLTDCGIIHITPSGYKLHDILKVDATTPNETLIYDDYIDGMPIFVNTNYRECDLIDRDFVGVHSISHIPYVHAEIMLYRSYYRLNDKSKVVMVVERLHKKHHIHDVYFIVNGNIMDAMIREDINSFLMDIKECE
jgi:hypothetical protein